MTQRVCDSFSAPERGAGREEMRTPDEVFEMRRLRGLGWGTRQIAARLGCSRTTVQRWLGRRGGWTPGKRQRRGVLSGREDWLRARFFRHGGNADVVRQELSAELGVRLSLRTVERAVRPYRRELRAEALATTRFETPPGYQLQVDFGERRVEIGGEKQKVCLFVGTLGCSRRVHARGFPGQRQSHWFEGMESAFEDFGGVPETVLLDNAKPLVQSHDAATRQVVFHHRFLAFARHWGFRPQACAPYRARTKGKDESGVGYVKKNAIAGRSFGSLAALEAHLAAWTREVANRRVHGTTGRVPIEHFAEEEAACLRPLPSCGRFEPVRELRRRVANDCSVQVDRNAYSVPWLLIGEEVRVLVSETEVRVHQGGEEVAAHRRSRESRQRITDPSHFEGVAGAKGRAVRVARTTEEAAGGGSLLRPLAEYDEIAGGSW